MAAMFPFFDTGLQVAVAMLVLYGLLAATSLSVKLVQQGAVSGMWVQQVNAWWRIFPLISLSLLTYPLGLVALAYPVYLLACLELAPFHGGHRLRYWIGAFAIAAGISFPGWQQPGLAQRVLPCAIAIQVFCCGCWPDPRRLVWLLTLATAAAMYAVTLFPMLPLGSRQNMAWLSYLFVDTALNDIGQFAAGKLFWQHKIAPSKDI